MSKFFKSIIDIKKDEISFSLIMSAYFFLVITTFWILKPLKKVAFVGFYKEKGFDLFSWHFGAADAELLAKVANMVVAFVAVMVLPRLRHDSSHSYLHSRVLVQGLHQVYVSGHTCTYLPC